MEDLNLKWINKCLQLCVMFLPILVWDVYFLLQCFVSFPYKTNEIVSLISIILLVFSILFGNSILYVRYTVFEEIEIKIRSFKWIVLIKNIYYGIPILITLSIYAGIPFYIYLLMQFIYMIFDKKHYTITERIYRICADFYKRRKANKIKEKESLLA